MPVLHFASRAVRLAPFAGIASLSAGSALAENGPFPTAASAWTCPASVVHSCSAKSCDTYKITRPAKPSRRGRMVVDDLNLRSGVYTLCPNAVDGCDRLKVKLRRGKTHSTVLAQDKDKILVMKVRNRDGRFVMTRSIASLSWVSYGTCRPQR